MNLRCMYCQTPFTVSRLEKLAALQKIQAEALHHYDVHCPRCRRANSITRQKLEMFTPGWQEGLKTLEKEAAQVEKEMASKAQAIEAAAKASSAAMLAAHKPAPKAETAPKKAAPAKEKPAVKASPAPKAKSVAKPKPAATTAKKPAAKKPAAKSKTKK